MRRQVLKDKEPQKMSWQSDYPIVSMKQGNACGEKGIEGTGQGIRDTSATPRGGDGMATKLNILTMRAKENPKLRFTPLTHLLNEGSLLECLIGRFLNAGVMEEGKFIETDKGSPQGGILSPVLANIYLHYILDLWFEGHVKRQLKGYACLIRYADDFVVCFQNDDEAKAFGETLRQRLDKFGLKTAKDKSRIIDFGRRAWYKAKQTGGKVSTFDFLGFTHYCDRTRKGVRNLVELKQWWQVLGRKLIGHYNYYGISGNMPQIRKFYQRILSLVYKWINRRSQKKSYNWEQFCRFLKYNPLPRPKIYHLT
ncbi:MAG: hypothetical protein KJ706_05645 [Candidatus Omnitrophica bacterium]|nr:hypothetical protein [Candidatus Omnitrophota bacterium]MBU4458184.1 hypothetical protein [Candidatus Omnitrophota bacterium]